MRCHCLVSNILRRYVGKCGEYVVVEVRRSPAACVLFVSVFLSIREFDTHRPHHVKNHSTKAAMALVELRHKPYYAARLPPTHVLYLVQSSAIG